MNQESGKQHNQERFGAESDFAFAQLLAYHVSLSSENGSKNEPLPIFQKPWKLYLNGDTFDFGAVKRPPSPALFEKYGRLAEHIDPSSGELKSTEAVALWKIDTIAAGHPLFFQALGWFIANSGNELLFLKGDDDIEIVWPSVQDRIVYHCTEQYEFWLQNHSTGHQTESPLKFSPDLPLTLSRERRSRIQFLAWFDHQKTLFYVEHGNQYDPTSAFGDILNPVSTAAPFQIEQTAGRSVLQPATGEQGDHLGSDPQTPFRSQQRAKRFYFDQLWESVKRFLNSPQETLSLARQLSLRPSHHTRFYPLGAEALPFLPLPGHLISKIEEISHKSGEKHQAENQRFARTLLTGLFFKVALFGSLLLGLQSFIQNRIFLTFIYLFFAATCYIIQGNLDRWMNQKIDSSHLQQVATEICQVLNENSEGKEMAVQFLIFGHDHRAAMEEIAQIKNGRQFRQWYINLGSWQQKETVEHRLQHPFLRLVPDEIGFETNTPELLEWSKSEKRPHQLTIKQEI